jgi:hypothetical protein
MSLIVARKFGNQLSIVSDTKLTYNNVGASISLDSPFEGVIKSVIFNDNLCVSFAGELTEVIDAGIDQIAAWTSIEIGKVIEFLTGIHNVSEQKTDFIIATGKPLPLIYEIKKGNCGFVDVAWIGDQTAFNRFQESFLGGAGNKNLPDTKVDISLFAEDTSVIIRDVHITRHDAMEQVFTKMNYAMDDVIADEKITCVGGFKVQINFSNEFYYVPYLKDYSSLKSFRIGEDVLIGPAGAAEGGYSINFLGGSVDHYSAALHIRQGNIGIVYHRKKSGVMRPYVYHMDEVDFIEFIEKEFQIHSKYPTVSKADKWGESGRKAYEDMDFEKAISFFESAMLFANDEQMADLLFRSAAAYYSSGNHVKANENFDKVVSLTPIYADEIDKLFRRSGLTRINTPSVD